MSEKLPQGWTWSSIAELSRMVTSGSRDWSQYYSDSGAYFVRSAEINDYNFRLSEAIRVALPENVEGKRTLIEKGDILVTVTGANVGKCAKVDADIPEAYVSQSVALAKLSNSELTPFVYYALRAPNVGARQLAEMAYGVGRPVLSLPQIRNVRIPLAPLGEQRRIVAKLETLLGKVDASQQRLAKIPVLLKRFRQSVLAAACSGRLTADWREENPSVGPASETLEAHAQRTAGRERNTRRMKPAKGLTLLDYSDEIPPTWAWLKVRELVERGAIFDVQDGNHGELYPRAEDFGDAGVRYISAEQVINDRVQIDSAPLLKHEKARQLRIGFAKANDVILTHNATVGRVALLPPGSPDVVLSTSTTYYRVDEAVLLARYLATFLRSHFFQSQLGAVMEQTTRNQVSVTKQVEFGVAIPPLPEQQEIVRRVEGLFALADQLEERLEKARSRVSGITPSLLARAFAGQLVPQDPTDEPASELLERIRVGAKSNHE